MTQNEINDILNDIKNKSDNVIEKYICKLLINNPNPMQKIQDMMGNSCYPISIYKLDKENIDDFLRKDIYDHPFLTSDSYYKHQTFESLTPKEKSIVCNLYFDCCLVGIHAELDQHYVTFEGVTE